LNFVLIALFLFSTVSSSRLALSKKASTKQIIVTFKGYIKEAGGEAIPSDKLKGLSVVFFAEDKTAYNAKVSGGMYEVTLPIGRYYRVARSSAFITASKKVCIRSSANAAQEKHTIFLTPVPEPPLPVVFHKLAPPVPTVPEEKIFTIRGFIKNSVTNKLITDDVLNSGEFSMVYVNKVTKVAYKAIILKGGIWQVKLPAGSYTRVIRMKEFAEMTEEKKVTESADEQTKDNILFLSPVVRGFRVVLTWGALPLDLDAHVILPNAVDIDTGEVNFDKPKSKDGHVTLDVDNKLGYGPETVTFLDIVPGVYKYYVNRYSNEAPIQKSGAKVVLFKGDKLIKKYYVPTSGDPTNENWHVFDIDTINHQLIEVNRLEDMW